MDEMPRLSELCKGCRYEKRKTLTKSLTNLNFSSGFVTSRIFGLQDLSVVVLNLNVKYWTVFVIVQSNCISRKFIFLQLKLFFLVFYKLFCTADYLYNEDQDQEMQIKGRCFSLCLSCSMCFILMKDFP